MPTEEFLTGFRHELANRAFAPKNTPLLSKRFDGNARG